MAAAALMSPATAYHPHNTSFPPSYSSHPPPVSMPGIVSPGEHSRRTSKESEPSQRQSLPSISEMFSAKPRSYSPTTPTSMAASQPLPPPPHPYSSSAPSRPEPVPESRPPPPPHFAQRSEVNGPGSGYQYGADQREHAKPAEPVQRNGGYASSHVSPVPYPPTQLPPSQLPPGQLPLSQAPPISPRHLGPIVPPFDPQRPPMHEDYNSGRGRYDSTLLKHHFETYDYQHCLQQVSSCPRAVPEASIGANRTTQISSITHTLGNFAEAYANIASEQHGGQPIPQRLPSEREVAEMIANVEYLRKNVETVRDVVQQSIANEKAREGRHKGPYDDDDVSMYGDGMKQHYGLGEVKKRRGVSRAVPPVSRPPYH